MMSDIAADPTNVDARGLACPQPVIKTRDAMSRAAEVLVIVDDETAQKNVTRMAQKAGASVGAEERGDGIYLHIKRPRAQETPAPRPEPAAPSTGKLVLVVPDEHMGRGENTELGHVLMRAFFHTLGEVEPLPDAIIFFNSGVRLVVNGSAVVDDLRMLMEEGVELLACGTCLGYYELKESVAVGTISNMYTIAETMLAARRLVYL